jgi:hypothetical protein
MDMNGQFQAPDRITPTEKPSVPTNRGGCGLRQTPTQTKCIIVQTIYDILGPYHLADLDVDGKPILKCVVQEEVRWFENWVDQGKDGEGRRKRCAPNSSDPGQKWVADCCEYGSEPSDPPEERNFLNKNR